MSGIFTLVLAKQDFKFSCGHFTLFGPDQAEMMHGHNYQVAMELTGPELDEEGLLADFPSTKGAIREICERLDSRTLIPGESPHLTVVEDEDGVEISYRDRRYRFPADDVLILPVVNTSIEILAQMIWEELVERVSMPGVGQLGISVSETEGQSCWYRASLP